MTCRIVPRSILQFVVISLAKFKSLSALMAKCFVDSATDVGLEGTVHNILDGRSSTKQLENEKVVSNTLQGRNHVVWCGLLYG